MVSTGSNDIFRNKLDLLWIRLAVVLVIIPVVVVALKSPDIIQVYLISDLVSASSIPVLVIGLNNACHWWRGFEVIVGGLGGLITVFIFGTIYFGDAHKGAYLLLLEGGLYAGDWSVFGQLPYKFACQLGKRSAYHVHRCFCCCTDWGPLMGCCGFLPPCRLRMDSSQAQGSKIQYLGPSSTRGPRFVYRGSRASL